MSTIVRNISELTTESPTLPARAQGFAFTFDNGIITWIGPETEAPDCDEIIDAQGNAVLPGFVDSHAHLIFAGDRSTDFTGRMSGQPY